MVEGLDIQRVLGNSQAGSLPGFSSSPSPSSSLFEPHQRQPFCSDSEGWGPVSLFRFDLTPCFLDLSVAIVTALFGLLMGSGAIWYLLKKRSPQPVAKNWHFHAKLVSQTANE